MRIKDLFEINKAITTSREFFDDNKGIPCVHYGDIYRFYNEKTILSSNILNKFTLNLDKLKTINQDSIIMPDVTETITDFGHLTYIKYDKTQYINGTHTLAILNNKNNNLKYLFYYLQSSKIKKQLQTLLLGSTVFQISKKDLENFELQSIHNENEQQHIVDIIGSLDDKIENNNKIIEKLWQKLQLVHTDFKSKNELVEKNILELADIKYGKGIPTSEILKDGLYSVYGSNGIIGYLNNYTFKEHKIAISCRGNSSGIIHLTDENSTVTSNSLVLDFKNFDYTYYFFLEFMYKGLYEYKTGSAQPQITIDNLKILNLQVPKNINDYIKNINDSVEYTFCLKKENQKLFLLKQFYLEKFFG